MINQLDRGLLLVVFALALLGLYNLASAGQPLGASLYVKQGFIFGVGVALIVVICLVHYRNLEGLAVPLFVLTLILLLLTSRYGKLVNGSRRWLDLGPIVLQTSDFAKLAVIVIVARTFHNERFDVGLTLREIFRPANVSRPLLLLAVVLGFSIMGDQLRPARLEKVGTRRPTAVARLSSKVERVTIGSKRGVDRVRLPHSGVSASHAEITRVESGLYRLADLGSETGTFINGERVTKEAFLTHGDVIAFGLNQRAVLRFSATIQMIAALLPWLAIVAAIWLIVAIYSQYKRGTWSGRDILAPIDVVALPCVLILVQPDLGTTLVVLMIAFTMILYVGLRPLSLLALATFGVLSGIVSWFFVLKPYQKERVLNFLNPTSDLAGAGYHQNQSLIAIGSGEMFGKGHGLGTQTQLSFLPEQQTDFIFSVWAEEHGFLGTILVVILFGALVLISLKVAAQARDRFGALIAVGVTAMIFWHTVINMLMVLRLAPVVGVPLPLWSNGGSFLLTTMIGLGFLFSVSMRRNLF